MDNVLKDHSWPSLSRQKEPEAAPSLSLVFCSDRACPELVEVAGILTSSSARRRSRFPLTLPHNREDTIPCSNSSLKTEYRMANSFGDKILPVSYSESIFYPDQRQIGHRKSLIPEI